MENIGIIRCEKNADRCPLTNCLKSLKGGQQGFSGYDKGELIGVFTCKCPGDNVINLGKILKKKGAEAIHFCTCTFAHKKEGEWTMGGGFCDHIDNILKGLSNEVKIPCIKGTAHLPDGYVPEVFNP
ncbi:MAG: CGGC domain-containing protein [Desulfobacterales bacterium]|jgi:predicted metal-binding protein